MGVNFLDDWCNVNTDTMTCLFPFSCRVRYDLAGLSYGIDCNSVTWVIFNDRACGNQNMIVLGEMSSGKSRFVKWKALWHVRLGGPSTSIWRWPWRRS
jgi:hypothetical protein